MPTLRETDAGRRYGSALWYAWGRLDERQHPDSSDLAFAFANMCRAEAEAYYAGDVGHLASVQDQWSRFSATQVT